MPQKPQTWKNYQFSFDERFQFEHCLSFRFFLSLSNGYYRMDYTNGSPRLSSRLKKRDKILYLIYVMSQ